MARIRSPNYPALSLPNALDKVKSIYKAEGKNAASREAFAKAIGFGGLNGGSAMVLSALLKYGLIEAADEGEARISGLAMRILYPETEDEKKEALETAALKPTLFADIREKWPDRPPSDDALQSFLIRRGFSEGAVKQVIQVYRETLGVAFLGNPPQDSSAMPKEMAQMANLPASRNAQPEPASSPSLRGRPFTVAFDGRLLTGSLRIQSVREIDRFVKVLQAQRAALEAMEDDDDLDDARDIDLEREAWIERQAGDENKGQ